MDLLARLPLEMHCQILRELDPIDLVSFAFTCTYAFASAGNFMSIAYTHYKILMPFLQSRRGVDEFVELMFRTGMVISGSQAIAFIYRLQYLESGLDLYVGSQRNTGAVQKVVTFLARYGYHVVEDNIRNPYIPHPDAIRKWKPFRNSQFGRTFVLRSDQYAPRNVVRIVHLKGTSGRVIQIIVPQHNVMDAILSLHSTVAMNIVTASHAYCLYARASLVEKVNITRLGPYNHDDVHAAIAEYADRGFRPVDVGHSDFLLDRRDEARRIGDGSCWSIPLRSGAKYYKDDMPPMERNSWQLVCDFYAVEPNFHFHHAAYDSRNIEDAMCVADDMLIALDAPPPVWIADNIHRMADNIQRVYGHSESEANNQTASV